MPEIIYYLMQFLCGRGYYFRTLLSNNNEYRSKLICERKKVSSTIAKKKKSLNFSTHPPTHQ